MLLAMSAWMRLMLGEAGTEVPPTGALPPRQERIRRALHEAVTAHPLHRELVHVHQLGGCQYFAFAGAMALERLGCGRAEVALGRVAFRTESHAKRPRWIGYPAAGTDLRIPDPKQKRHEAEAFPFHAWIVLTGRGRRSLIDFDLSNVLREVRLQAPLERLAFHRVTPAFWGTGAEAREAGLRFEARRLLRPDALMPGDRRVFEAIAEDARARLGSL
ncbi:hypothetical protein [Azospirillum sp. sgz302134]